MNRIVNRNIICENIEKLRERDRKKASSKKLIMLVCDDTEEAVSLYCYHVMERNAVMLVGNRKSPDSLAKLVDDFDPDEIFVPAKLSGGLRNDKSLLYEWMQNGYQEVSGYRQYMQYVRKDDSAQEICKDVALLMMTSGSVGNGKIVALSYENLRTNAQAIIKSLEIQPYDRAGVMLPISYVYGLSVVNSYLLAGGELLFPSGNMFQTRYWDYLERNAVNSFCGVPYTYEIIDKMKILHRPWKELKLLTQAGGAMSCMLKRKLLNWTNDRNRKGMDTHLAIMYGQTEATARMSSFFLDRSPDKIDSVGRAISGGSFQIRHPDFSGNGDIIYHGANVCMAYVRNRAELSKNTMVLIRNGDELDTGDIGHLDEDGYLYISGRRKRFIKLHGVRISLDEMEKKIEQIWGSKVVCTQKPSEERINIFVRKGSVIQEEVRKEIKVYLRQWGFTETEYTIFEVDNFCYHENGKINYEELSV